MLYIATVHYASPRWIEIQTSHIRRHVGVPHQVWTSLERIDPSYGSHFDKVLVQRGMHAAKLNNMAMEICTVARDDDLIMFLDGDAFPIADPMPLVRRGMEEASLVAIRRAENFNEPQPHPSFTVTTVGTWKALPGDWTAGYTWTTPRGTLTSDVGGNLLRRLELTGTPWFQVLRSNRRNLDILFFGVYGDAIYHHGAGFAGGMSPAHRAEAPTPLRVPQVPLLAQGARVANGLRWRRWERGYKRRLEALSQSFYDRIAAGGDDWLAELM